MTNRKSALKHKEESMGLNDLELTQGDLEPQPPSQPPEDEDPYQFNALGHKVAQFQGLETFPTPEGLDVVELESDEVTAVCPVTSQPDWYTVRVTYCPDQWCVESKSFKLLLQSYRNRGLFCEALACEIRETIAEALGTISVCVVVIQKARGGVSITARAGSQIGD